MVEGDEMAYRTFHDLYFDRLWRYLLVVMMRSSNATNSAALPVSAATVRSATCRFVAFSSSAMPDYTYDSLRLAYLEWAMAVPNISN